MEENNKKTTFTKDMSIVEISSKQNSTQANNVIPPVRQKETKRNK